MDWLIHTLTSSAFTGLVATTLREGAEEWNARPWAKVLESVFLNIRESGRLWPDKCWRLNG